MYTLFPPYKKRSSGIKRREYTSPLNKYVSPNVDTYAKRIMEFMTSGEMSEYDGNWKRFIDDIKGGLFIKDQWQFQMQCRALEKVGQDNLFFITNGLKQDELNDLSVNGCSVTNVQKKVQDLVNRFVSEGKKIAAFPEGPYCAPLINSNPVC